MKHWKLTVVEGVFSLVVGVVLMMWGFQAVEPIDLEFTLPTVTASLDPTFILLFIVGMGLIGNGVGILACARRIYKLEK